MSVAEFYLSECLVSFGPVFHLVKYKGAGEGAPGTGAEISLQPMERTTVEHCREDTYMQLKDSTLEEVEISWRNCSPWRPHFGVREKYEKK